MTGMDAIQRMRLDGRLALVTGASRGIGRAIAEGLAGAGADLALAARGSAALQAAAEEISGATGRACSCFPVDMSDFGEAAALAPRVLEKFGRIDILVNNAGTNVRRDSLEYLPEDWDQVLTVNLKSQFFLTQAVARHMKEQGGGKILNIGSMSAHLGIPAIPAYTATKAAMEQLTRMLAVEWAEANIQVNAIAPGWIDTALTRPLQDDPELRARYDWVISRTPAGRFGEPGELAGAAVLLCSPAADFITGQVLAVDGGILAGSDWRKGPAGH